LRTYAGHVAATLGIEYVADEGDPYEPPGMRNDTLYVTSIRDPIGRTISNYEYEGRWKCGEQRKLMKEQKDAYMPLAEHAISFESFMEQNDKYTQKCPTGPLWGCHSDCHARWFAAPHRLGCAKTNSTVIENAAYEVASNQHLIIRTEFLRNEAYVAEVERYFGVPGIVSRKQGAPVCDPVSKRANSLLPAEYSEESKNKVRQQNVIDYRLFDKLHADCPEGIIFPERTLLDVYEPHPGQSSEVT